MNDKKSRTSDYIRIAQAIRYLECNFKAQPPLHDIAARVHLSPYHFQRLFRRWAGVTPKRYLQFLTAEYAKQQLRTSRNLLAVTHAAGLSSTGRLHDLFVTLHAATPGEWKAGGDGLRIRFGFHASPFGEYMLALTPRGICSLQFVTASRAHAIAQLARDWPQARLLEASRETQAIAQRLFAPASDTPLALHVRGSNFQIKVWEALLRVPAQHAVSYSELAQAIGSPRAARAVGNAVGRNPVALLIPCHRVIRAGGDVGGYRWGSARKRMLLAWEAGRSAE